MVASILGGPFIQGFPESRGTNVNLNLILVACFFFAQIYLAGYEEMVYRDGLLDTVSVLWLSLVSAFQDSCYSSDQHSLTWCVCVSLLVLYLIF